MPLKTTIYLFLSITIGLVLFNVAQAQTTHLIKTPNDPKVYLVDNNRRVHIPNPSVFEAGGYKWSDIKTVSQKEMDNIPDTALIKSPVDAKVYLVKDGAKQWIPDEKTFLAANLKWSDIILISQPQVEFYNENQFSSTSILKTGVVENKVVDEVNVGSSVSTPLVDGVDINKSGEVEKNSRVQVYVDYDKKKLLGNLDNFLTQYNLVSVMDVNKSGTVVGCVAKNDWDLPKAFIYLNKKLTIIGPLKGLSTECAQGVNDLNQVVGDYTYLYDDNNYKTEAFLWDNGKITKLGFLNGGDKSSAVAINNKGQVVGWSVNGVDLSGSEIIHSFIWQDGVMKEVKDNKSDAYIDRPVAINEKEQVLGEVNGYGQVLMWQNGVIINLKDFIIGAKEDDFVQAENKGFNLDGSIDIVLVHKNLSTKIVNGESLVIDNSNFTAEKISLPKDISTLVNKFSFK